MCWSVAGSPSIYGASHSARISILPTASSDPEAVTKYIVRISSYLSLIWRRGLSGISVSGSDSSPERDELNASMLTKPSCYFKRTNTFSF